MSGTRDEAFAPMRGIPPAEVTIDEELVRALLEQQHPELASLPLWMAASGWDNAMVRIGDSRCARLPRRGIAAAQVEHEQRWLPELAQRLPLPIPSPIARGRPGAGYPWRWSVVPWLPGRPCALEPPHAQQAGPWSELLASLHVPAPDAAPHSVYRGGALAGRAPTVEPTLERVARATPWISTAVRRAWREGLRAPAYTGPPLWIHGDLHARNVLVEGGAISGVIDWGDLTAGDRATDLASLWTILPSSEARREAMRRLPDVDAATWARARAWAVLFGVMMVDAGLAGDDDDAAPGRRTLAAITSEG